MSVVNGGPMRLLGIAASISLVLALCANCNAPARTLDAAQLPEYRARHAAEQNHVRSTILDSLARRVLRKLNEAESGTHVSLDMLVLSGGGQYGAFGAGVLSGWRTIDDAALRLPEFDLVTGISTGALLAPFAFLGDAHSQEQIIELYEQVEDDWAIVKATLFFLPWRPAFFDRSALADYIDEHVDAAMVARLASASREHRLLLVGSTNLDLGSMHIWNLTELAAELERSDDLTRMHRAMLASSAIPGAFEPVEIDGMLHVDGAVSRNLFVSPDPHLLPEVLHEIERLGGDLSRVCTRVWVIVNGSVNSDASVVSRGWPSIVGRSMHMLISSTTLATLRLSEQVIETLNARRAGSAEFRFVGLPGDAPQAPHGRLFDRKFMAELVRLGTHVGSDPSSWCSDVDPPLAAPPGED